MTHRRLARSMYAAVVLALTCTLAHAQSMPTAARSFTLAGWGAATGNRIGIDGGRNIGITAGFDVGFRPVFGLQPEFEVRGIYPIDSGTIVGQRSILGGLKLSGRAFGLRPYGNFLYGRGEMDYQDGGYPIPATGLVYTKSSSNIYSIGGGADRRITPHFALKADYQFQIWDTPVTASGHAHPQVVSLGVLYHINVDRYPNPHPRHWKTPPPPAAAPAQPSTTPPPATPQQRQ